MTVNDDIVTPTVSGGLNFFHKVRAPDSAFLRYTRKLVVPSLTAVKNDRPSAHQRTANSPGSMEILKHQRSQFIQRPGVYFAPDDK